MCYILVIWVSNILYLIHKSLKTVLFKFLNSCKLVRYEEKKTVVRSTATVRPGMSLKRDSNTCAYIPAFMQKEKRKEGTGNPHIVCTLLSAFQTLYQNFKRWPEGRWEVLTRPKFFERGCWERERWLFSRGLQLFYIKINKSEYLMTKKVDKHVLMFFYVISKNSNWKFELKI